MNQGTMEVVWDSLLGACQARHGNARESLHAVHWSETDSGKKALAAAGDRVQALELLECLMPIALWDGPLAIGQLGQSLDGRIATESGHSHYINGPESLVHLHRLRAMVDGVLVGASTAAEDNPQLTVRRVPGPNPVRIVLDPRGRVDLASRVFTDGLAPTIHLVAREKLSQLPARDGVRSLGLPMDAGPVAPARILNLLAAEGLERILVEGGGQTVSSFLQAGCLDCLHLLISPMIIGSGRPGISLEPIERLDDALRPTMRIFDCGQDRLADLDFRKTSS